MSSSSPAGRPPPNVAQPTTTGPTTTGPTATRPTTGGPTACGLPPPGARAECVAAGAAVPGSCPARLRLARLDGLLDAGAEVARSRTLEEAMEAIARAARQALEDGPRAASLQGRDGWETPDDPGTTSAGCRRLGADGLDFAVGRAAAARRVDATILFADIRDFTALTRRLGPEGAMALLNEWFDLVAGCLDAEGGLIDKFVGDAVMATFGVPVATGDDGDRAVRAALAILRALGRWNGSRSRAGRPTIEIGIGISSGVVVAGRVGSRRRADHTVIGDAVNLASRLQEATRTYGTPLLVGEDTHARLRGTYVSRAVDRIRVRGRSEPVLVHEILAHRR